jgi:DNA-binding SARP family transcriptional activator/CRP-like cAMP-binding protein
MNELLKQIPLFSSLSQRDIRFLAQIARQLELPANTILFKEGAPGNRLYLIAEGELEIIKALGTPDEIVLRVCYAGEPIGEMSFLNPEGVRSATVRAKTRVRLIEIARDDFELLMLGRPGLALAIARGLSQRLVESENRFIRTLAEKSRKLAIFSKLIAASVDEIPLAEPTESISEKAAGVPQIQIYVLGRFQLFLGETLVTGKEWSARQPQLLLKALITRGAENVPKDLLIEDMWPDTPPDDGKRNFKVVLHRLRKTLGNLTGPRSPYIWFKGNKISLNRGLVRLDIDEFLSLYKRARRAEQAGDIKGSIAYGNSAIELYKGDYLEDELYTPWTALKREEIRAIYVDILRRTAANYENQGSSRRSIDLYKLVAKTDPTLEEAYQKLMLTYSNLGMRTEAIRVYNECRRALDRELGVDPDKLTTSIYERIIES